MNKLDSKSFGWYTMILFFGIKNNLLRPAIRMRLDPLSKANIDEARMQKYIPSLSCMQQNRSFACGCAQDDTPEEANHERIDHPGVFHLIPRLKQRDRLLTSFARSVSHDGAFLRGTIPLENSNAQHASDFLFPTQWAVISALHREGFWKTK